MPLTSLSDHGEEWHLYLDSGKGDPPHHSLCEDASVSKESQLVRPEEIMEQFTTLDDFLREEGVCNTCRDRLRSHLGLWGDAQ